MACLNKLAIRGIRSFDDKQISVIEFFSPVTVIVGHNGSGKTTIIECLKYATTGDQPPNTRGGAFVHDPKMANEKEVKAQVKLRFRTANGTRMLAVRNLSVTVKKTSGLTMKTLESILALADSSTEKGGKRGVISTKCAEMDAEIPQLLGVSKAVLDNVIFCHQEDSNWPLAEPASLKKKFDDIFEATRYTKALDSIKVLRKDRIADLKAEKERLLGLSREKTHADKLKARISETNSSIATKQVEYEETKKEYEAVVEANRKFYDYASKFREMYLKIETLTEKKQRLQADLDDAKLNLQEVAGTDDELQTRLTRFDDHINSRKQKRRQEDFRKQDLEDEMVNTRKQHTELVALHGGLVVESNAQSARLTDREELIREINLNYGIMEFSSDPLERDHLMQFLARLAETQRKLENDVGKLQSALRSKEDEYHRKQRKMDNESERLKLERDNLRQQITDRQSSMSNAESRLELQLDLSLQLQSLQSDLLEKKNRLQNIKSELATAQHDSKINDKILRCRLLEEQREKLNAEIRSLTLQSDLRAKLNVSKGEIKTKKGEILNFLGLVNTKLGKLIPGKKVTEESIENEINDLVLEKDRELVELEDLLKGSNNNLHKTDATVSSLKARVRAQQDELKALERKLVNAFEGTLEVAIKEASEEVGLRKTVLGTLKGGSDVYASLLRVGKQKKKCTACDRHLNDDELVIFEKYLTTMMAKASRESIAQEEEEMRDWENELGRLQGLRLLQASHDQIQLKDLPGLEHTLAEQEREYAECIRKTKKATDAYDVERHTLKDFQILKDHSRTILRLRTEISRAEESVLNLESDLSSVGSTKTADDVETELDNISENLRTLEKEKQHLMTDKERQKETLRTVENNIHSMELKERDLKTEIREKASMESSIETMKKDILTLKDRIQVFDVKISETRLPIHALEEEQKEVQKEFNDKIADAQRTIQGLNLSTDKIYAINKAVERYVKDRRGRKLEECSVNIEHQEGHLKELGEKIDGVREAIREIDKEINASGASIANLRDNIRVRKLAKEIDDTLAEINSYDMDEAAKARRNFEEKYSKAKERENSLQASYSHLAGEASSLQAQLKGLESDLREFKDIYKRYTEQLIQVKMSDMANSDLEKYAKALDNAIMKYHSLKMEEVNDTMKHLWNKTYQGTDIDGIRIVSDMEGGVTKRSYNYRVVMTKDQVEMDMRGRCSAGQKMLASIIIRLALSDSFGQNCGLLALDEPTNALDTENIDALAASLVDIINERKSHSNFQLIIITHDENFLRKLGQSDVMEYYWRVQRDSRQKSVIERHRFR